MHFIPTERASTTSQRPDPQSRVLANTHVLWSRFCSCPGQSIAFTLQLDLLFVQFRFDAKWDFVDCCVRPRRKLERVYVVRAHFAGRKTTRHIRVSLCLSVCLCIWNPLFVGDGATQYCASTKPSWRVRASILSDSTSIANACTTARMVQRG